MGIVALSGGKGKYICLSFEWEMSREAEWVNEDSLDIRPFFEFWTSHNVMCDLGFHLFTS